MVARLAAMESGEDAGRYSEDQRKKQRREREFEGIGIALQDEVGDGIEQSEGLTEVAVEDAAPVVEILLAEGAVEAVLVAEEFEVGRAGAFAEHLLHGVAWDQVDEQEDEGDDQPEDGDGVEETLDERAQREPVQGRAPDGWETGWPCFAAGTETFRDGAATMGETRILLMRWPAISTTVNRCSA